MTAATERQRARRIERAQQILADGIPDGPRLEPCVCSAPLDAHAGTSHGGGCKDTGCRRYRPDGAWELAYAALDAQEATLGDSIRAADRLDREAHRKAFPRGEGEWSISPSDTSTCPRKLQYRNLPPEDYEPAITDNREARMGTIIHDEVTRRMRVLYPWRMFALRLRVDGLDRESELDWYDPITGEVTDLKTAGDYKWDNLGDDGPDEEVWGQVALYGLALEDMGYPVKSLRLDYLKRANGHDEPFRREYERAFAEKWRDYLMSLAARLDLVALDPVNTEPLPRTEPGPSHSEICRRCEARNHCWNIPQAEQAGRSPESYTALGPDPDDPTIAYAIEQKLNAAAVRLEAKKAEDEAKGLTQGLTPGRYGPVGEYTIQEVPGGGSDDWKARVEQLEQFYPLPETARPTLDTLNMPKERRYTYPKVGRTRKATLEKEARERAKAAKAAEGETA